MERVFLGLGTGESQLSRFLSRPGESKDPGLGEMEGSLCVLWSGSVPQTPTQSPRGGPPICRRATWTARVLLQLGSQ